MTLLTYADKYIVQSASAVQSTSTTFGDDTQASQTFTLYSSKTVLVIYAANAAHGNTNSVYGFKNAINVDGTDHSIMSQSAYAANYSLKNTCVWVGTLTAGSHTIKGRLACNAASTTTNVTNRTLIIYIFDGDEFNYIEDTTAVTLTSTSYSDDAYASVTETPSAACKALVFYGVSNDHGVTERYVGKKILINTDSTDRTASEMFQSSYNTGGTNADSNTTVWAESITAVSRTFKGRWAGNGAQTTAISRRFFCVLFLDDSTIIDVDSDATSVVSSTTALADDGNISITRSHEGELLCLYAATKATGKTSAIYGTAYGIMLDSTDVAVSRSTPAYSSDGTQALIAYAATVASGSHTVKGRFATNYSTTNAYATKKIMVALWFPVKTPLTYNNKYVISDGTTVSSSSSTLADDTPASKTFSLSASQTVLVFYNANSNYGDTNNVAGFKSAISIDGTDYATMYTSGYAANYPMRNCCVWAGVLSSGSHTVKGRFGSNTDATNTSITNRTLIIYILNGDAVYYLDDDTSQSLTNVEAYVDDSTALLSVTPKENCKALILYGITNAPGNAEHYVGKKACVAVNGTDYIECEAKQSSYSTGGSNPDSLAVAYGLSLTANTNYVVKGRASSAYTYATTINRRFIAVLLFDDGTLIDTDSSTTSENTTSASLVDDPDISVTRTTSGNGELLVFYNGCKTISTTSDIQGTRFGIMIDGHDSVASRTSQAYSGSANSCLVGMASTVFDASHTIKGRYSANEDTGTVYITTRNMIALWLVRTVVNKNFTNTHDVKLSKPFIGHNDIRLYKSFVGHNDIRLYKSFIGHNDIRLYKSFIGHNDIRLYKSFIGHNDIRVWKIWASSNDIIAQTLINKYFQATNDIKVSKAWASSNDERLSKTFINRTDIGVKKTFSGSNDLRLSKAFTSRVDIRIYKTFTNRTDISVKKFFSGSNDLRLFKTFISTDDVKVIKAFSATMDLKLSKAFVSRDDIRIYKAFVETNDIKVNKQYASSNDERLYKTFSVITDIKVLRTWGSSNDERLSKSSSAYSDISVKVHFNSASDIKALYTWAYHNSNDIKLIKAFRSTSDLKLIKSFHSLSDTLYSKIISSHDDIHLDTKKSSSNDLRLSKKFASASDLTLKKVFEASLDIFLSLQKAASSDVNTHSVNSNTSDIRMSKAFSCANDILEALFVQSTSDILLYKHFSSHNEVLGLIWSQFVSSNNIQISKAFESYSDIAYSDVFSSTNDIGLLASFAADNDIRRTSLKFSRNDVRLTKYCTSRNDIRVYKVWSSKNTLWLYSVKSSKNDIKVLKKFISSNDLDMYKKLASSHDVFVKKNFSAVNKVKVDRFVESSNNILLEKEFKSTNDVLEFLKKLFASTNSVLLVEEFINSNNINIEKSFSSTNIIVKVIWDLTYPLTVVVSQDERTVVISAISREVFLDELPARTVIVDSNNRTVTVDQSDRGVTINKW